MVPGTPRITIPERFNEILGNTSLGNGIRLYVQRFDAWVSDDTKGLFFFPEYTDHGPKHITSVLFGAEALIREEAWKAVTAEDVTVLTAATLFHDAAMHLSADGFLALIDPKRAGERPLIGPLDTQTWPELFAAYYSEAKKWDQRKLHRILGDEKVPHEEEPDLMDSVRRPEEMPNSETWSTRYRKFLGEFVRRHHARLAHEIARDGYPGHTSDALKLPEELSRLTDLSGLVARSHNMLLRDTFGYLKEKYRRRVECLQAHPVFLMVLLRVADYLEIRSDRVNLTALSIQRVRSPISLAEHSSHLAIHDVQWPDEDDKEAIFVFARPDSARLFLKLQELLKGLQAELDTSWAVLGEVYSKQGELSCLGIKLRRVRSNLDSPAEYERQEEPSYFPIRAAFDTTGADLLKLLIKPLYGDRPEIGVRELLQNALDAVHELRQWAADNGDPEMRTIPLPKQEADVLISIDRDDIGNSWLTVRDKGIGMTVEVVRDYFLKAGASYRESSAWRKEFEDEEGSRVLRSGRFGVGALAAFLLGEHIEVATRYVKSPSEGGISFTASIIDDVVELNRVPLTVVGTTVRIRLSEDALDELVSTQRLGWRDMWDWFTLDDPIVERRVYGCKWEQAKHLPLPWGGESADWREISIPEYAAVLWGYDHDLSLVCNGIDTRTDDDEKYDWEEMDLPFIFPSFSVFDRDGKLPLNLHRDGLVVPWPPFEDEIYVELVSEICAFLLLHAPTEGFCALDPSSVFLKRRHPPLFRFFRLNRVDEFIWPICYLECGTTLFREDQISGAGDVCLCLQVEDPSALIHLSLPEADVVGFVFSRGDLGVRWVNFLNRFPHARLRVLSRENTFYRVKDCVSLDEEWRIFGLGAQGSSSSLLEAIYAKVKEGLSVIAAIEWRLDTIPPSCNIFDELFRETMDTPIIPYDPAERRRKLPNAFARLEKYLKRWEPENLTGWRLDTVRWFRGEPTGEE